ncbi:NADP-dependent oxidoreductase [Pseudonocardia broussonetiae]|uniref:NADP-dependent oxidoreductase n=1 Tax=Pseudonocardia broussonetiae TaxID=2736640 RepID=A0A6M6JR62_9PSEU|nr:NADP-dependent oxidoreductase [Pseudonocardia broussonetiae]QJY48879.1 NADP-dependent oxidoreductase [Pseudonocardia broussonetiae]
MRAMVCETPGGPEALVLQDVPVPEPGPGEVRVRVEAAGVNPIDWKTRSGLGPAKSFGGRPFVVGWDVAGVVDALGPGATGLEPGDPVLGMARFPSPDGAYAEFVTAPAGHFRVRPPDMDAVEAAALPLAGMTAWQSLYEVGRLAAGQRVLIHAAAGGVGHLAVQIAKAGGAHVVGTASAGKQDLLRELGCDQVVDYRAERFEEVVEPVDLVYDLVGGETAVRSFALVKPSGMLICLPTVAVDAALDAAREHGVRASGAHVVPGGPGLDELLALRAAGRLRVLVAGTFPLEQAADAHRLGEQGRTTGKIVLTV